MELTGEPDPALPPPSSIRNEYDVEREAARSDSRIFVFFLDDYHVRDINALRMRESLIEFVETRLAPTDLVGVMYPLTPLMDLRLTRDHSQIVRALSEFEGRKYNYAPENMYEHQYAHYPTTTVEMIRNDVSLSALKALSIHLGGLREGRKSAIVLSEGYSNYVPPQMRDENAFAGGYNPMRYDPLAGENRVEELEAKVRHFGADAATWHMIGHLQSRKARRAVAVADVVHSVDSLKLARKVSSAAMEGGGLVEVLVQVNTSGEESKSGFAVNSAFDEIAELSQLPGLRVNGLMTMAPFIDDEVVLANAFASLRRLSESLVSAINGFGAELSMGMTNDLDVAIREGSTMVRIGTALFGPRPGYTT